MLASAGIGSHCVSVCSLSQGSVLLKY